MAYNSLKSYWIWRRKKEAEEKEWRAFGVDENIIDEIHDFDRITYNSDERFYKRLYDVGTSMKKLLRTKVSVRLPPWSSFWTRLKALQCIKF